MPFDFDRLKDLRILVVGDMIVDHYRVLSPKRISPEAPVIIFQPCSSQWLPGGAGNVANNLISMGVGTVHLAVAVGDDWEKVNPYVLGTAPSPSLSIVNDAGRVTTVKERLITNRQQLCRIDLQSNKHISLKAASEYIAIVQPLIKDCDVVICSDYDHGAMIPEVVSDVVLVAASLGKPVVVDSKSKNLSKYNGATIALPNNVEAEVMTGWSGRGRDEVARRLLEEMGLKAIGMTLGAEGIMLRERQGSLVSDPEIIPSLDPDEQVVDVTGAGDTVTAAVSVGLALGMTYHQSLKFANIAAGVVVLKRGVATTTIDEIKAAAAAHGPEWDIGAL